MDQISEKQARKMIDDTLYDLTHSIINVESTIENWKKNNYIKQSPFEKAEDLYERIIKNGIANTEKVTRTENVTELRNLYLQALTEAKE